MSDVFSFSAGTPEEQGAVIDLRSRANRLDPARLASFSKLPSEVGRGETPVELRREGNRLSRQVHIEASKENVQISEVIPLAQTPEVSAIQDLGHLPLSKPETKLTDDSLVQVIRREIQDQVGMIMLPAPQVGSLLPTTKSSVPGSVVKSSPAFLAKQRTTSRFSLKETAKFVLTSAAIFLVTLIGINFSSYYQMVEAFFQPEKLARIAQDLNLLSDAPLTEHRTPLLPIAGVERKIATKIPVSFAVMPPDNRLIIPKLGKNVPIVDGIGMDALLAENWKELEASIQDGLHDGVVHYPGTASPGQYGNVFITGHSSYYPWDDGRYKSVFALLGKLEVGDEYTVLWRGKEYKYRIQERKVVKPEDTSVLTQPADKELSTLMTCWPVGSTENRLIYVAERIAN